jgi:CubicO group peptidase (beta-lactamase class C family)
MMMNRKKIVGGILTGLFFLAGCTGADQDDRIFDRKYIKVIKKAREETFNHFKRNFIPGGAVSVSVKGKLVWSEGFGKANNDLDVPATRSTKFRMGQITEVITALAYYRMAEEGLLDPETNVWEYLPEYPEKSHPLKLRHLISHTSGIRIPTDQETFSPNLNMTLKNGIQRFSGDTLLFPPGMYQYPTIFSYDLLGRIMELRCGEPFPKIISKWVTDTLKLLNTVPDNPFTTIKGRSGFFDRNIIAHTVNTTTKDLRSNLPSIGYLTTADDLTKLGNALLSSPLLSDSVRKWMLTPPVISDIQVPQSNGLMFLTDQQGAKIYAGRGLTKGSGTLLVILPEQEIVVSCTSNLNDDMEELPGLMIALMFRDFVNGTFDVEPVKKERQDSVLTDQ